MSFWSSLFGGKKKPSTPATFDRAVAINTVPNAKVKLDQVGEATTNHDGYHCWTHVSSNYSDQHIWVTADGYEPYDQHITLTSGKNAVNQDIFVGDPRWSGSLPTDINLPALTKIPVVEPPPVDPLPPSAGLKGVVRLEGKGFKDDTGYVNPVFCHAGDLLSRWCHGKRDHVLSILDTIKAYGYHGVRTWTVLQGSYWVGYEVGPYAQSDYWEQVKAFFAELRKRELYWLVSQGDLLAKYRSQSERQAFMRKLAEVLERSPYVFGVDAGNETFWNGEDDPSRLDEVVRAYLSGHNVPVWSRTSAPTENVEDINKTDGSIFDVHGERGGNYWDKIRHIFSIPYEGKPDCRLGIQSEPFGCGKLVSATANMHEVNTAVEKLGAGQSILSRQVWVYFCSPGIKSDATGEKFEDMYGFKETPAFIAKFPKDIMSWNLICHGGNSWKGTRVFAVNTDDGTRADHAFGPDGQFVVNLYGPSWKNCPQERPFTQIWREEHGPEGCTIYGRL